MRNFITLRSRIIFSPIKYVHPQLLLNLRLKNKQMNRKCYNKSKSILYIYNKKVIILQGHENGVRIEIKF